jgi:hypothetical protein
VVLAAGSFVRTKAWRLSTMRSGTTSPCAIAEPSPQVALKQHVAVGGLAQTAAGGARGDQRLHQHRHRGVGGIEIVLRHRAARIGGPQRRPAGAQRGEEFGVVGDAEKAFELAGEARIRRDPRSATRSAPPRAFAPPASREHFGQKSGARSL